MAATTTASGDPIELVIDRPRSSAGAMIVLAHGAGGSMSDPLLVDLRRALVERGHGIVRFDFRYRTAGRKLPDKTEVLEATWREVLVMARRRRAKRRFVIGGKSMGGRMASHLAAAGHEGIDGLLLLGYPLHPPKRPDKLRSGHLPAIEVPTLFVQGTRDPLCDLHLLRRAIAPMGKLAELNIVDEADHSLAVPKRKAQREAHMSAIADRIDDWIARRV
jgi:uncharacterized protein